MRCLLAAIALTVVCTCHVLADAPSTTPPVQLTSEPPIVSRNDCIVQRFRIDFAKGTPEGFITLELGGNEPDKCVYPSAKDAPQSITITVVAMIGRRQCVFHIECALMTASQAFSVAKDAKIKDVIRLDAQGGTYALEQKMQLGEYAGHPLLVTISPKAFRLTNPQSSRE